MNSLQMLDELYRHMAWADSTLWTSVLASDTTASNTGLRERLYHIALVQRSFYSIWTGEPLDYREVGQFEDSAAVARWAREHHERLRPFLATLSGDRLDEVVLMPWAERLSAMFGTVHPTSFGETLVQVASHSTNHRGQVLTKLRELGSEPPLLDFIAWIWRGKPGAEWPV
jgi:uncharacterized damage-inducible protein DinB